MLCRRLLMVLVQAVLAFCSISLLLAGSARRGVAAEPAKAPAKLAAEVRAALELGVEGKLDERNAALTALREHNTDYGPAHWHSGELQAGKRWTRYDAVTSDSDRQGVL